MRSRRIRLVALGALAATALGISGAYAVSSVTDASASTTSTYTALSPSRVLDTRHAIGVGTSTPVKGGSVTALDLSSDVPADATAVTLNVTVTAGTGSGYLIVYPAGKTNTTTSSVNWVAGQTAANQVTVQLGTGDVVDVAYVGAGTVAIVADLGGYYQPTADTLPVVPQAVTASATTLITNDQDSGFADNWAVDTLTRQMTVTRHGAVAVSDCGGTSTNGVTSCYYYTAIMTDAGSFTTIKSADSPNAGTPINGVLSGSIQGGSSYEFYASSGAPDGTLVTGSLDAGSSGTDSSHWPTRFFPKGTSFGGVNEINWSYVYNTPTTCETWTDAYNNGDGHGNGDGDITGVNQCTGS